MTDHFAILPILLPLLGGIVTLFLRPMGLKAQRLSNLLFSFLLLALTLFTLQKTLTSEHSVYLLGNWLAPYGIVLVLDQLAGLMLVLTAVLACAALCYAISQKTDELGEHFHVLYQVQLFGLNGAFLTGDLFNLFVFFEVLLLASYGLLLHGGGRERTKSGLHYVVINLVGSALFLFAVGTLYGILGTLNIADLAQKVAIVSTEDQGIVSAAALLLLVVFGIKAAVFPLYLWLPGAYSNTSAAVAALFAIMTKVGLYAMIRVHGTLFSDIAGPLANIHANVILVLGMITLLLAALGVFSARGLKEQAAFLILASVSTLLIGIGMNSSSALAATLYYLIHSTLLGAAMFLLADIITHGRGLHGDRLRSAPAMSSAILLGSIFIFSAVAITGMPPLSGFLGKAYILSTALLHPLSSWIFGVILLGSLLMIVAMARTGSILFYQINTDEKSSERSLNYKAFSVMIMLLLSSPALVIFAGPVSQLTSQIAEQINDTEAYIDAVIAMPAVTRGH